MAHASAATQPTVNRMDVAPFTWWVLWCSQHVRLMLGVGLILAASWIWWRSPAAPVPAKTPDEELFTELEGIAPPSAPATPTPPQPFSPALADHKPASARLSSPAVEPLSIPWPSPADRFPPPPSGSTPPVWLEGTIETDEPLPTPTLPPFDR